MSDETGMRFYARLSSPIGFLRAHMVSPLGLIIVSCLTLGLFLRIHAFGFPSTFLFDEHHFVENARNYLRHQPDWNDHPPLGKLLIAASIRCLGDTPSAWRAPALLAGVLTVVFGAWASARLFRSNCAGFITAALFASDGFFSAYSRAALLDMHLAAASVVALWLTTLPASTATTVTAGLLIGAAASIKFSGSAVLIPLLLATVTRHREARVWLSQIALAGAIALGWYVLLFDGGLYLSGHSARPIDAARETARLLRHHAGLTDMKNPWVSSWPTWAVPLRPIILEHTEIGQTHRVLSSLGNLAIWWTAIPVGLWTSGIILWRGIRVTLKPALAIEDGRHAATAAPRLFVDEHGPSVLLALSAAGAFLAPWVLTHRDSYIYHFLPSYAALLVLLGGYAGWAVQRRPRWVLTWLSAVLVVAAIYTPVWTFIPVSEDGLRARLFLKSWR